MSTTEINTNALSALEKKRLSNLYRHIESSNKAFEKMTMPQKRVQIARDVLRQLRVGRMEADSVYFDNSEVEAEIRHLEHENPEMEVRDVFRAMPNCNVCGIGSCFVAVIDRVDKLKLKDLQAGSNCGIDDRDTMTYYLVGRLGIFTNLQLNLIEAAFENHPGFCPSGEEPNKRLARIMRRIIQTEGRIDDKTFKRKYDELSDED